jgi:hypothetical protein
MDMSNRMESAAVPEHWNADGSPSEANPWLRPPSLRERIVLRIRMWLREMTGVDAIIREHSNEISEAWRLIDGLRTDLEAHGRTMSEQHGQAIAASDRAGEAVERLESMVGLKRVWSTAGSYRLVDDPLPTSITRNMQFEGARVDAIVRHLGMIEMIEQVEPPFRLSLIRPPAARKTPSPSGSRGGSKGTATARPTRTYPTRSRSSKPTRGSKG